MQGGGGLDALDHQGVQGAAHAGDGLGAVGAVGDELGHHGIVVGGDDRILVHGGIHADAGATGEVQGRDAAGAGRELEGILGVDAALDGVAPLDHVLLGEGEPLARGDAQLLFHDVDARDQLGDGMLHLDAGVHFHEEEIAALIEQEFDGARVVVADGLGGAHGRVADALAKGRIKDRAGAFLDEFLVATLDGTFAFAQVYHVAEEVAHDLDFDVARLQEVFLHVDAVIAEGVLRLAAGGVVEVR